MAVGGARFTKISRVPASEGHPRPLRLRCTCVAWRGRCVPVLTVAVGLGCADFPSAAAPEGEVLLSQAGLLLPRRQVRVVSFVSSSPASVSRGGCSRRDGPWDLRRC